MLKGDEINIAEIKEIGSVFVGGRIAFRQFESNAGRIVVMRTRVVDRNREELR